MQAIGEIKGCGRYVPMQLSSCYLEEMKALVNITHVFFCTRCVYLWNSWCWDVVVLHVLYKQEIKQYLLWRTYCLSRQARESLDRGGRTKYTGEEARRQLMNAKKQGWNATRKGDKRENQGEGEILNAPLKLYWSLKTETSIFFHLIFLCVAAGTLSPFCTVSSIQLFATEASYYVYEATTLRS